MPALLPIGDAGTRKTTGGLIETAAHRGPLCLIGPAAVMKRGYISRPLIINAAADPVKEASVTSDALGALMACHWLEVVVFRHGGVCRRGGADAGEEGVGGFDGDGPGGVRAAGGVGVGAAAEDAHHRAVPEAQDRAAAVAGDGRSLQAQ